ncbi:MAG: HEAT repeat domain-containing protein [Anaerolineae bacterium]|nr:HEAT repeat domain-containing protein [Anaerolineae bacterium]
MSDFRPDIWRLQAKFDIQGLIEALKHTDPNIRKRAAAALRALGATPALPALKAALAVEHDPETRANIVAALDVLELEQDRGSAPPVPEPVTVSEFDQLIEQLNSGQPEKVIASAIKLGEMRDKRAAERLVLLFNNNNIAANVRLAIAEALLKLESAPVEVALLGALRSPNWRVRRNGAAILGQVRADWSVDPLAKALHDENEIVRKTARAALRFINTPEALAALNAAKPEGVKTVNLSENSTKAPREDSTMHIRPSGLPKTKPIDSPKKVDLPNATPEPREDATINLRPAALTQPQPTPVALGETAKQVDDQTLHVRPPTFPKAETPPNPMANDQTQRLPRPDQSAIDETLRARATQKLVWPKRDAESETDPSKIQTKPLDPNRARQINTPSEDPPDQPKA